MSDQLALPVEVPLPEVRRKATLGAAIVMCMELAGFDLDKEVPGLKVDKAQFSRWKSGEEGIKWPKLQSLMDACGNDAPLLWMLHRRGYDLHSLRKQESETERQLRLEREGRIRAEQALAEVLKRMPGGV
jgi:hypothetical protein